MKTATKTAAVTATVEAPAAQAAARPAKVKAQPSAMVANIRNAAAILQEIPALGSLLQFRVFNSAGSFVVRLPDFKSAVDVLPHTEDAKKALQLLRHTRSEVEALTGSAKQTWVFHASGSFGLYSKLAS